MIKKNIGVQLVYPIGDKVEVNNLKQFLLDASFSQTDVYIYTNRIFTETEIMILEEYDYEFENILIISDKLEVVEQLEKNTKLLVSLNGNLIKPREEVIRNKFNIDVGHSL